MHVAKFILYDVARKVDSCNIARKVDAVLREKSLLQVVPCNITLTNSQNWFLCELWRSGDENPTISDGFTKTNQK